MKKIGLISDTHGYIDDRILKLFENCDEIWHAGDIGSSEVADQLSSFKKFRAVHGNIDNQDIKGEYPEDLVFYTEKMRIWITHIGGYPPDYTLKVKKKLNIIKPDIFICGHSHIVKIIPDRISKVLHINPGAAGHQGFHKIRTIARFSIDEKIIKDLQIVELGKRGKLS